MVRLLVTEDEPFDLLIVDHTMPEPTGLQLLTLIERGKNMARIPVILLTYRPDPAVYPVRGEGKLRVLIKPFHPQNALVALVAELLRSI